ncbi:MAG TPA: FkbM family methyltransferase [Patescibacteria group bacterium]|nr:FkbM family methyltransferase [Patescibacteria group bacterium]
MFISIRGIYENYANAIIYGKGNKVVITMRFFLFRIRKRLGLLPTELRISHSKIIAIRRDGAIAAAIYALGYYDYHNMHLMKKLMPRLRNFIDIGANIGVYSLIASEAKRAKVYAFEPYRDTYQKLRRNIEANNRHNIFPFNYALGSRNCLVGFRTGSDDSGYATVAASKSRVGVECRRMDVLCRKEKITPTLVKIDTEGSEYEILKGFGRYLKKVKVLFIELNIINQKNKTQEKIIRYLNNHNFGGPYRYDHEHAVLANEDVEKSYSQIEDSIFVADSFMGELQKIGITIKD